MELPRSWIFDTIAYIIRLVVTPVVGKVCTIIWLSNVDACSLIIIGHADPTIRFDPREEIECIGWIDRFSGLRWIPGVLAIPLNVVGLFITEFNELPIWIIIRNL